MTRKSKKGVKPLQEARQVLNAPKPTTSANNELAESPDNNPYVPAIRSLLGDENCHPSSSSLADTLSHNAAALYDELDSFRQRWKRELEETKQPECDIKTQVKDENKDESEKLSVNHINERLIENSETCDNINSSSTYADQLYSQAKKLFMTAVDLEQDEMHHESIRYYKQAMHLCPDIERLIFREQCEASAKNNLNNKENYQQTSVLDSVKLNGDNPHHEIPLKERIHQSYIEDNKRNDNFSRCRPSHKLKVGTLHISDLPHELIMKILHYIIGHDLDLASLESIGLVCRGLYLLSRDQSIWRSICYSTWGSDTTKFKELEGDNYQAQVDWRQMFLERPHVNFDGVYISRTRYIRQGDVGFQDLTYRPFHVIRYYRYIRFFSDRRVLILTTNEEPDKIIPIFRHAIHAKQFSPDLSILEGTFELSNPNCISISAEKDCRKSIRVPIQQQRRQAQFYLFRQTPISQKFSLKFELKTVANKPYSNNVLKWLDYTILSRMETGQEVTSFDLTPDSFPNLIFSRVKRLNLKLTSPLHCH